MYVLVTDTIVGFYSQHGFLYPTPALLNFKFPVIDNEAWCTPEQGYSYSTGIQNVSLSGHSYNSAIYLNKSTPIIMNSGTNESYWIVKNVGIVEEFINDPGSVVSKEILIAYHIN